MSDLDVENAALEARIAELESIASQKAVAPQQETAAWYSPKQLIFDAGTGVAKGVAGTADVLGYLPIKALNMLGADMPTFGTTRILDALIKGDEELKGLEGPGAAQILNVDSNTPVQEAVSFMTPGPGSKGSLLKEAGFGLASYLGSKAGEAATESPYGSIAGAIFAPLSISGLAKLGGALTDALSPTGKVLMGDEDALRAAAQTEVIDKLGARGVEKLRAAQTMDQLTGVGGSPLTLAEIVQEPRVAKYQTAMQAKLGSGDLLQDAINVRKLEQAAEMSRLGTEPGAGQMQTLMREMAADEQSNILQAYEKTKQNLNTEFEGAQLAKALQEERALQDLGFTPDVAAVTTAERGNKVMDFLINKEAIGESSTEAIWRDVPKETLIDASKVLNKSLEQISEYNPRILKRLSSETRSIISDIEQVVKKDNGLLTVDDLQSIRRIAGDEMARSGISRTDKGVLRKIRDNIDNFGLEYAYDPNVGARGGLPRTPGTMPDLDSLTKLSNAIEATRAQRETFNKGAIGQILAKKGLERKTLPSEVVDKLLSRPEYIDEFKAKFGVDSVLAVETRAELLSRMTKASKPYDYILKHEDKFKAAFREDLDKVKSLAKSKETKLVAPDVPDMPENRLAEYAKITDAQIPSKVFDSVSSINKFISSFQETPLIEFGRSRFINDKLLKSGNALANLQKYKEIAQPLFRDKYSQLENLMRDIEISKTPAQLQKAAANGNSITSINQTVLGAVKSGRAAIGLLKAGKITAPIAGALAGIPGAALGSTAETLTGAILGTGLAAWAGEIAKVREEVFDGFVGQFLSNPKLIDLATAPPTEKNIKGFFDAAQKLGYFTGKTTVRYGSRYGSRAAGEAVSDKLGQEPNVDAPIAPQPSTNFDEENALLEERIKQIEAQVAPQATVQVGKQNISLPVGEKYPEPSLIKAVIQVESNLKPKAVSNKGAKGLMQIMPATAKDLGLSEEDMFDPDKNVEAGARYLQQLVNKYDGDVELALAAYNWGLGRVDKAISRLKSIELKPTWSNIVDNLGVPRETRDYVRKVKAAQRKLVSV